MFGTNLFKQFSYPKDQQYSPPCLRGFLTHFIRLNFSNKTSIVLIYIIMFLITIPLPVNRFFQRNVRCQDLLDMAKGIRYYIQLQTRRCQFNSNQKQQKMFYRLKSFCCIKYYIQFQARKCQFKSNQKQDKMFYRLKSFCCIQYCIQLQARRCQLKSNQKQDTIFNRLYKVRCS